MSDTRKKEIITVTKKKKNIGYVIGNVALFAAACVVIPFIMAKATGILYKASSVSPKYDEDDWGPVIERKNED